MFTGLIADIGTVREIRRIGSNSRLTIESSAIASDSRPGDSVAVNGACLTVTEIQGHRFSVDAVAETMGKTNLGRLSVGASG